MNIEYVARYFALSPFFIKHAHALDDRLDICEAHDHDWVERDCRFYATLEGFFLYHDPSLTTYGWPRAIE